MKYMKIGILPDTFYTEEATRTLQSDVPSDLTIQVNNTKYLLHKFPLLLKCGLLQRLCSNVDNSEETALVQLHDLPGDEEAFEICVKFCYGIAVNLSARNFFPIICTAKYLRMTESVSKGNLIMKLESFFNSCVLQGWKDSIVALEATRKIVEWSENIAIVQQCKDSIVRKILAPAQKVTWSYTYTRPGYDPKKQKSVPKDWWTEDVSDLDLETFRTIIVCLRSPKQIPAPLIGEALHVYACKHLQDPMDTIAIGNCVARVEDKGQKQRQILETIVSMIPNECGSVSASFLLKLLKVGNYVGASPSTIAELIRQAGRQLHEAMPSDLLFPLPNKPNCYDIDLVVATLEVFLSQFHQQVPEQVTQQMMTSMQSVAKTIDCYLQIIAHNREVPIMKIVELAQALPEITRLYHDGLYYAIDTYLKEHTKLSKEEKNQLCQILDCRKLSREVCSHAISNERLPLRKVVQILFFTLGGTGCGLAIPQANTEGSNVISKLRPIESANQCNAKTVTQQHKKFQKTESCAPK